MIKWTYCVNAIPEYSDLVQLADVINYSKRRMWTVMNEPYGNGYDDDSAQEFVENCMDKIEILYDEYFYMSKNFFESRTA